MMIKNIICKIEPEQIIPKNMWWFPCCHCDLHKSDGTEENFFDSPRIAYKYKWMAKIAIMKMWLGSRRGIGMKNMIRSLYETIRT